VIFSKKIELPM